MQYSIIFFSDLVSEPEDKVQAPVQGRARDLDAEADIPPGERFRFRGRSRHEQTAASTRQTRRSRAVRARDVIGGQTWLHARQTKVKVSPSNIYICQIYTPTLMCACLSGHLNLLNTCH
jgi:hypothetical protein